MVEGAHQIYKAPQYPFLIKVIILLISLLKHFLLLQVARLKGVIEGYGDTVSA